MTRSAPVEPQLVRAVLDGALHAPSPYNTQPWIFETDDNRIRLRADFRRRLAHHDPTARELFISCGAALFTMRVVAARLGRHAIVEVYPDPSTDLAAEVTLTRDVVDPLLPSLYSAIPRRRTWRQGFDRRPVTLRTLDVLRDAARIEGADLRVIGDLLRDAVADLVAQGDRAQSADKEWRRELAIWSAVPGLERFVLAHFDGGRVTAAEDHHLIMEAPAAVVLLTANDTRADWIRAGEGLQRLLLVATRHDLSAGFVNQPCQVPPLRERLRALLQTDEAPQIMLRLGHAAGRPEPAVRRDVEEMLALSTPATA